MKTHWQTQVHSIGGVVLVILGFSVLARDVPAAPVDEGEALRAADLWYAMEMNLPQANIDRGVKALRLAALGNRQVSYLVSQDELVPDRNLDRPALAYVIEYQPTGYVVVLGDDRLQPVIVFDLVSEFRWDEPQLNFLRYFLGRAVSARYAALKAQDARGIQGQADKGWDALRANLKRDVALDEAVYGAPARAAYVLWSTALWDQLGFYNDTVVPNNGGIEVPTGCTATAMAIKMRFHSWPPTGSGTHSYNDTWGTVRFSHFVNYGAQTYNWASMPTSGLTSPNPGVADLMYHCGVAVNMDYERGGSGAWPSATEMNTHFQYKGTIERTSDHSSPIRDSIVGGLPVVLSSSAHTVVACGWRSTPSPFFYINAGWSGFGNGWYDLNGLPPDDDPTIDRSYPYSSPGNYIYVDLGWSGSENGNIQNPYNTLSEGVAAVPNEGHVWLKTGAYSATTLTKAMTIHSYEGTVTIGQ